MPLFSSLIQDFENELQGWLPPALQPLLCAPVIEPLHYALFRQQGVHVDVLRCDQLHPVISGNKWFKLKYNLLQARRERKSMIASFGGAWSNHLHALAYCAREAGFASVGFVRGEELSSAANPMLQEASAWGMTLRFLTRSQYRERCVDVPDDMLLIPEGGDNVLGVQGCMTLVPPARAADYDAVVVPLGTGCTALGVRLGLPAQVALWVAPVLKGDGIRQAWQTRLQQWQSLQAGPVEWLQDAHQGGYGKTTPDLLSFIRDFGDNTGLPLDPVYSGKAMRALCERIYHDGLPAGRRVLFIHTGGLQGARGFQPG